MGYIGLSGKGSSIIHIRRNVTKMTPHPFLRFCPYQAMPPPLCRRSQS